MIGSIVRGISAAFIVCLLALPALAQQAAVVGVDAVRVEPMAQTIPLLGRVVARQSGEVAARTGGPVAEVRAHVGDRVERGAVLAVLDRSRLRQERDRHAALIAESEAQINQALAQSELRKQELDRIERLRQSAAFSKGRFDDALAAVHIADTVVSLADARRISAQANLSLAEIDLAWAVVKAPYPGVVTRVHTEVGAWLSVGQAVVTMINDQDLEIEAEVPSSRIAALVPGADVTVELDDGTRHVASVRATVPVENALTRTRQVRLSPVFGPTEKALAANQSATVYLPAGRARDAVTVHKDAILRMGGQTMVYVAQDGQAMIRPVQLGEAIGIRLEVLSGLAPGESVVIRGNERLQPGQAIQAGGTS